MLNSFGLKVKARAQHALQPHTLYLLLSFVFGLAFILLIKPLNTPDEPNHFLRAYQVSEGSYSPTDRNASSCVAEYDVVYTGKNTNVVSAPKSVVAFTNVDKNNFSVRNLTHQSLQSSDRVNACVRQTEANSPIGYLPQAFTMWLLHLFNSPPVLIDYAVRLVMLSIWTAFIWAAIRILPVRKWSLFVIALMPIAVQQSMSIGADVLAIAPVALVLAVIARSYYENRQEFVRTDLLVLSASITIASQAKPVMLVLILGLMLYGPLRSKPNQRFLKTLWDQASIRIVQRAVYILVPLLAYMIWSYVAQKNGIGVTDIFELAKQKSVFYQHHTLRELKNFVHVSLVFLLHGEYWQQYGSFEWFTKAIPNIWRSVGLASLVALLIVGYKESAHAIPKQSRFTAAIFNTGMLVIGLGIFSATMFSLYLIWTPIDAKMVQGIQFRYFIPVLFVAAVCIGSRPYSLSEKWYQRLAIFSTVTLLCVSVLTLSNVIGV